jgi:hypothetical protein
LPAVPGSQWHPIVLFDENRAFYDYRECWFWTAITRAADRLTVAR